MITGLTNWADDNHFLRRIKLMRCGGPEDNNRGHTASYIGLDFFSGDASGDYIYELAANDP